MEFHEIKTRLIIWNAISVMYMIYKPKSKYVYFSFKISSPIF